MVPFRTLNRSGSASRSATWTGTSDSARCSIALISPGAIGLLAKPSRDRRAASSSIRATSRLSRRAVRLAFVRTLPAVSRSQMRPFQTSPRLHPGAVKDGLPVLRDEPVGEPDLGVVVLVLRERGHGQPRLPCAPELPVHEVREVRGVERMGVVGVVELYLPEGLERGAPPGKRKQEPGRLRGGSVRGRAASFRRRAPRVPPLDPPSGPGARGGMEATIASLCTWNARTRSAISSAETAPVTGGTAQCGGPGPAAGLSSTGTLAPPPAVTPMAPV